MGRWTILGIITRTSIIYSSHLIHHIHFHIPRPSNAKRHHLLYEYETYQRSIKARCYSINLFQLLIYLTYAFCLTWQAVVLNNVSRPIRRGSYFGNIKPRKPTLGRHFKYVTFFTSEAQWTRCSSKYSSMDSLLQPLLFDHCASSLILRFMVWDHRPLNTIFLARG